MLLVFTPVLCNNNNNNDTYQSSPYSALDHTTFFLCNILCNNNGAVLCNFLCNNTTGDLLHKITTPISWGCITNFYNPLTLHKKSFILCFR